ncbi:hypothetical protein [Parasphingorhabdus sp.]|uniref:hypothetical protein n=1 Tax=Parasphingorhabdus sp. TaxID=2709688 RepID=UPI003593DEFB
MTVQNMFRLAFWLLLGIILILALIPADDAPSVSTDDKLNHILAFFTLSFMARLLWPRLKLAILFLLLTLLGGAIELLQLVMGFGREADWMDFGADVLAIALGLLAAKLIGTLTSKSSTAE